MTTHALTDEDAQTYLDLGVTAIEVVWLRFPEASKHEADVILWECTPYPLVGGIHDIADWLAEVTDEARMRLHADRHAAPLKSLQG